MSHFKVECDHSDMNWFTFTRSEITIKLAIDEFVNVDVFIYTYRSEKFFDAFQWHFYSIGFSSDEMIRISTSIEEDLSTSDPFATVEAIHKKNTSWFIIYKVGWLDYSAWCMPFNNDQGWLRVSAVSLRCITLVYHSGHQCWWKQILKSWFLKCIYSFLLFVWQYSLHSCP